MSCLAKREEVPSHGENKNWIGIMCGMKADSLHKVLQVLKLWVHVYKFWGSKRGVAWRRCGSVSEKLKACDEKRIAFPPGILRIY